MERKKSRIVNYRLSIKNYPLYKDSAIDWIGEIPKHWEITAVTSITTPVSIKNHPNEELLSVYRDHGVIIKKTREDNHNRAGENLASYKLVEPNYLVINKMKAWQGSLGISEFRGIVSPAYITCKTDEKIIARGYLHHLLRCRSYINEYNRLSYGVRNDQWDMRYDDFKYVPVLLPPLSEQKDIAHYLDTKIAQIDRKIDLLTQKAQRYEELKRAIVNETVTRGLDKSVPMKDSVIEWIGEIPEHWEVDRAKSLFKKESRPATSEDEIVTVFRDGQVTLRKNRRTSGFTIALHEHGYQGIRNGDLVIHAMDAFAGAVGVSDSDGKSSPVYSAYTPVNQDKVHNPYYGFLIRQMAISGFISSLGKGIRERSTEFRNKEFSPLELIVPPLSEQKAIAAYLDTKTAQIDQIIQTINTQIEKLQELRKTLINDVVTGKIKVIDN